MNLQPILDIHDLIEELTRTHSHREPYIRDRNNTGTRVTLGHVTTVPSLVHQLLNASPASSGEESGSAPVSRPAARIEAIDTLMLIDDEAARWVSRLGEDDPGDTLDPHTLRPIPGSGTIACLRRVHALHAGLTPCDHPRHSCCRAHTIEHDVRRWWHQARIISGWDSAAWRPDNTCPVCEQRRSLRVNVIMQTAVCVECREVWTSESIGLLAEHIRAENHEDQEQVDDTTGTRGA